MKLVVKKQDLSKVMQISQSIVEKKSTMPILQNALLEAIGDTLTISSSDMEITVISKISANIIEEGKTTINANFLANIVRELPDSDVLLELEEGEILSITSGKAESKILGISAESFPKFPTASINAQYKIKASVLLPMINKTCFAVSSDDTRWNLNGVCFQKTVEKGKDGNTKTIIKAIATDGHRVAVVTRQIDMPFFDSEIIIPKKGVFELKKILEEEGDNEILLDVTNELLVVETKCIKMGMRLIDSKYPNYMAAMPKGETLDFEFEPSVLLNSMKRMTLMNTDKNKKVLLHFENNLLTITSINPGVGEAKEEIEVSYDKPEPMDLGFNTKYMSDVVSNIAEDSIIMETFGSEKAIIVYSPKDPSAIACLMPVRIRVS